MDPMDLVRGVVGSADKQAALEKDVVKHILRRAGFPRHEIDEVGPRAILQLDELWAGAGYARMFPVVVAPRPIDKFSIEDIFERPSRSAVLIEFKAIAEELSIADPYRRRVAMPFKAFGLGKLVALDSLDYAYPGIYVPGQHPCCVVSFDKWVDKVCKRE